MSTPNFNTPPPPTSFTTMSFPTPQILLVTLNRPKALNCISSQGHQELHSLFSWLDTESSLRCGIITGAGRAFCAGADLLEWNSSNSSAQDSRAPLPPSGFGGLSRRTGKKPIIAAVNGLCLGGGCEMVVNIDIVIASPSAIFALPEVKIGVVALAGALPRLIRTVGKQRASEMTLTGRNVSAEEAREWGLVNQVVGAGESVVDKAVEMARAICENSPDSVIVSKKGVDIGWEGGGVEEGTRRVLEEGWKHMERKDNMKEGVRAFVEKRRPRWVDSKL